MANRDLNPSDSVDQQLKRHLRAEMSDVRFSLGEKGALAEQIVCRLETGAADSLKSISFLALVARRMRTWWNGTTEFPLPTAALIACVPLWVVGSQLTDIAIIDEATAAILLQMGTEYVRSIDQGVSLL